MHGMETLRMQGKWNQCEVARLKVEGWAWEKGNRGRRAGNRKKKVPGAKLPRRDLGGHGPLGPEAGGRVLCVSSNLGHRCLTGASSCILAFPSNHLLVPPTFFLRIRRIRDREAKVQRSGGGSHSPRSSSSTAGTQAAGHAGQQNREWTVEGRAPVGQVPPLPSTPGPQ